MFRSSFQAPFQNAFSSQGVVSAFTPLDITGLQWWFKADAGTFEDTARTTPATDDGDVVKGYTDQSVNSHHATEATNAPTLKLAIQNGLPVLRYDGTNDKLVTDTVNHNIGTGDFYVAFVVVVRIASGSYRAIWANGIFRFAMYTRTGTAMWGLFNDNTGDRAFNAILSLNTPYLLEVWRESGTLKAAVNGVQESNTYANATNINNAVSAFGNDGDVSFGQHDHCEQIYVNNFPSAQQASIRSYLMTRWGL